MYFRTFTLGTNTEKLIEKEGFRVNSFQEVKSYCENIAESIIKIPKDYMYDGSIWGQFDISNFSERLILLCRMPIPPFIVLWNLLLNGNEEDSFGALCIITQNHVKEFVSEIQLLKHAKEFKKLYRKKLLKLKINPIVTNCVNSKQIVLAIDSVLDKTGNDSLH